MKNGPHKEGHSSFGSGGSLRPLATAPDPFAVLQVPLKVA